MLQRYLPPLARRALDRERDLERRLAPAGIVRRFAARQDRVAHVVEHGVASGISAAARERELALAGLAIDEHAVRRGAQLAARTGRNREAEMRLMWRLARIRGPIGEARGAQRALSVLALRKGAARGAMRGLLRGAALGDPEMQLVGIKEIVAAIDQRGRDGALELQEGRAVALGGTRRIENADLRPHASHQAAAEEAHGVDLMRHLVEQDAAAL